MSNIDTALSAQRRAVESDLNELTQHIGLAMAIRAHPAAHLRVAQLAGAPPHVAVAVRAHANGPVLESRPPRESGTGAKGAPALASLVRPDLPRDKQLRLLARPFRMQAEAALRGLIAVAPLQAAFQTAGDVTPLGAHVAFRAAARISGLLDLLRPHLLQSLRGEGVRTDLLLEYWLMSHVSAHLALLAVEAGETGWLVDIANQVEWRSWTPSWPWFRERTLWLSAAAGRICAGFGPCVADRYLAVLRDAVSLSRKTDAVLGLLAIACAHPASRAGILGELDRTLTGQALEPGSRPAIWRAFAAAAREAPGGLATPDPLCLDDPGSIGVDGRLNALRYATAFAARPGRDLYRPGPMPEERTSLRMATLLLRAWTPSRTTFH